ncbi:MAG: transporter substrate-binding domain-containing protein [Alphaproteobacteria bacterium]|nr:transporter substrate-binding domain-containing protein [Alphaproteobacteria bacterium]
MRNSIKISIMVALVLIAIIAINVLIFKGNFGVESGTDSAPEVKTNYKIPDVIRIATEGSYPPFNGKNTDGTLYGFDVELGNALCAEMQRKCEFIEQVWEGIIPGLKEEKYDAIMAAMSITPERALEINFSDPYFDNSLIVVGHKGSAVNTVEEIKNKTVGVQKETVAAKFMSDNYGRDWDSKLFDTQDQVYENFIAGRIDYFICDFALVPDWIKDHQDAVIVGKIQIEDHFGIAVRKEDKALLTNLNAALKNLRSNGRYDEIYATYFSAVQ